MRPVRQLKNFVLRLKAIPGSGPFKNAARQPGIGGWPRIYHYHIRKTAGTSLNHAFLATGGEPGEVVYERLARDPNFRTMSGKRAFVGWSWGLIEQGRYHYAFSHHPAHALRLPPGTFTITCLRDPVRRLVSYYTMLCELRENKSSHNALKLAGPWMGNSFSDFLSNAPRTFLSMQLSMFSARFDAKEAAERVLQYDAVLFTEHYAAGVEALARQLGVTLPVLHVRPAQTKRAISEDELARAREMLRDEYVMVDAVRAAKAT